MLDYRLNAGMAASSSAPEVAWFLAVAGSNTIVSSSQHSSSTILLPVLETPYEREEREWEALNAKPEIQRGLNRLAEKIRANAIAGKFEEGGFGIE